MRQKPTKLGVPALLLLVISICMTTLGVLTFSTAQADLRLSERYAEMTRQQYGREAAGQAFLQEADLALKNGIPLSQLEGVVQNGDIFEKAVTKGNSTLHIGLKVKDQKSFEIVRWETSTQWSPQEQAGELWGG